MSFGIKIIGEKELLLRSENNTGFLTRYKRIIYFYLEIGQRDIR